MATALSEDRLRGGGGVDGAGDGAGAASDMAYNAHLSTHT